MASLTHKLLTSLAAVCATSAPTTNPEFLAGELLALARAQAGPMTACHASADDAAVEATLRILLRHPDVLTASDARRRGYVQRSVRNALRDDVRKRRRAVGFDELWTDGGPDGDGASLLEALPEPDWTPTAAELDEFRAALPELDRTVLEGLELGQRELDIAAALGTTRHEVRTVVARLRRSAERYFGPRDEGGGERLG